jgi:hypothetical protein
MHKSYYFLGVSHVNVFVFYCKAYNQSVDFELKHLLDKLPDKIDSGLVLTDLSCEMGGVFQGEVRNSKIKSECFNGRSRNADKDICELANAYSLNILMRDFDLI